MNIRKAATALGIILIATQVAFADAGYDSTTEITGGTLVDQMKQVSFLSKSMRDMFAPTTTTTRVSGNRKVTTSKDSIEITNLDKETITRIDIAKKTYTVMTFAQMRDMMKQMPAQLEKMKAQMAQAQGQQPKTDLKFSFDTSVKDTGESKMVNGLMAQEQVITIQMHVTDPSAPATAPDSIAYTVTTDTWVAPDPPEVKEIQDFDMRMGKKLMEGIDMAAFRAEMQNAGMSQMFAGKPGSGEAMAQMTREINKLKGTRVLEVTSMGGVLPPGAVPPPSTASAPPPPSGSSVADQAASDTATQTAQGKLGVFGSALGAFHKKKPATAPTAVPEPAPAAASATPDATTTTVVMMSTTTQKTNFSRDDVPASAFAVPAGFKEVAFVNPMDRMNQK